MQELTFQSPQAAFLLIFVAFIVFMQIFLFRYRQTQIQNFADSKLLPYLLQARSKTMSILKIVAWGIIWILLCLALMSPEGNVRYLPVSQGLANRSENTKEIVFLIDTSASMGVLDGENEQSRLDQVKTILQNLMSQLKNVSVSIYAFTSVLTPIVPQTLDYLFTRLMIHELAINEGTVGGTHFQPVLEELKSKMMAESLAYSRTIFLFSDGEDNQVYANDQIDQSALNAILNAFTDKQTENLHLLTIGVGGLEESKIPHVKDKEGKSVTSRLHPELLKKLASKFGGTYFESSKQDSWTLSQQLLNAVQKNASVKSNNRQVVPALQEEKISDLYFQIPLFLAILLLFGGLIVREI